MTSHEAGVIIDAVRGDPVALLALHDMLTEQGHAERLYAHTGGQLVARLDVFLWLVERTDEADYEEVQAIIVVARTEDLARRTNPYGDLLGPDDYGRWSKGWAVFTNIQPDSLGVTCVGMAADSVDAGTVLLVDKKGA